MSGEQGRAMPLSAARAAGLRPEPATQSQQSSIPIAGHTPLPWALSQGYTLSDFPARVASYVAPEGAEMVGIKLATPWIEGAWDDDPEAAANAAFIVRAVNSHYELIDACREAALVFSHYTQLHAEKGTAEGRLKAERNQKLADKMNAAIAHARGETA